MINQEKHFEFFIYDQVSTLFHDKAGSSDQFIKTNARLPTLFFFRWGREPTPERIFTTHHLYNPGSFAEMVAIDLTDP